MKRRAILLALTLIWAARATEYPDPKGYVNDFAGNLPADFQKELESRLRAYEQATSNEVAVAVVPSLQGESVEDYAQGLFRAWGIGKGGSNNGVLFLWAPTERKVRIQVGTGLEQVLTNPISAEIVSRVISLFRQERYVDGVRAGVDGIMARLGGAPLPPPPAPPSAFDFRILLAAVPIVILLVVAVRIRSARRLRAWVPPAMAEADQSLEAARAARSKAEADLQSLRSEAPQDVWQGPDSGMSRVPAELEALRSELDRIRARTIGSYGDLKGVARDLRLWEHSLQQTTSVFGILVDTLAQYREAHQQAMAQISRIPQELSEIGGRLAASDSPERNLEFLRAAEATFNKARELRAQPPVNWLLVADLLNDVEFSLEALDRLSAPDADHRAMPEFLSRTRPRLWSSSSGYSPAVDQINTMLAFYAVLNQASFAASSDSSMPMDSGGGGASFGGDSGGGFGGGDTGSGGASGSY